MKLDLIHAGHVEDDAAAVEGYIVVADASPARSDSEIELLRELKGFVDVSGLPDRDSVAGNFERVRKVFKLCEIVERE